MNRPLAHSVPLLRVGEVLLVTLPAELTDDLAAELQRELSEVVARGGVRGVVIDLSAVWIVDSFLGRVLAETAAGIRLLAADTIVAGLRPAIAITLVELGMTLHGLRTALSVEAAFARMGVAVAAGEKP
ncbi:anti-anti-sigma factor [Streptomyces ambofaciens]|uniref:Anti-anti-sigma factor n=1 Tax=Streptomyces ambofaciens TaxID=1889 RepID=A0ABM6BAL9_STRAM|nr:STAS domain-containing protein [Streptomyces ambofaciens]ANB10584.1 anti-anti-sigma factor [Streptomyces ambofaciens]